MDPTDASQRREQRFRALYDAVYFDLLCFVQRRVHATHAEDVVGEVMLVAWRRLDDVPTDLSAARAWLFGVARRTLLSTRRRECRQVAAAVRQPHRFREDRRRPAGPGPRHDHLHRRPAPAR